MSFDTFIGNFIQYLLFFIRSSVYEGPPLVWDFVRVSTVLEVFGLINLTLTRRRQQFSLIGFHLVKESGLRNFLFYYLFEFIFTISLSLDSSYRYCTSLSRLSFPTQQEQFNNESQQSVKSNRITLHRRKGT